METDKPQISILMAVYEPRMDWLEEQLNSLNEQPYPNLRLYIRDDASPTIPFQAICELAEKCITAFPYTIQRNEKNLGSNGTFERLTEEAEGAYFAYCDQDDVWLPEKLARLYEAIRENQATLVCSDMYIIDGNGKRTAGSITEVRRHHKFRSGTDLAEGLLVSNFVTGCTMMVESALAKDAVPFCPYMVHDHYLAFCAARRGKIVSLPENLILYRIHGNNQTVAMAGVHRKADYVPVRVELMTKRLEWLSERVREDERELREEISRGLLWSRAREANFRGDRKAKRTIWNYRRFSPLTSCFEIVMSHAPNGVFMFFIYLERKNVL